MGIDSIGSQYINNIAQTDTSAAKLRSAADKMKAQAGTEQSGDELLDVCKQFEAYFIEQVLKEVKKTVPDSTLGSSAGSNLVDFFMDETLQKVSANIQEKSGLGLAQQMYEQMKRNYNIPEATSPVASSSEAAESEADTTVEAGSEDIEKIPAEV